MVMMTTSTAPVAMVLHSSASASFPPASFSAMMPEPTTAITRKNVPSASAARRRVRSYCIAPLPRSLQPQQQPPLDFVAGAAVVANGSDVPQPGKMP